MSDQLIGKKGSEYPKLDEFTEEQRTTFLGSTLVHAIGKLKPSDTSYTDANLVLADLKTNQIQADWNEQDDTKVSYIKNKPEIPSIAGLATEEQLATVSAKIENEIPSLDGYALKTDLPTAESLAGLGLLEDNGKLKINTDNSLTIPAVGYHADKLGVAVPVPAPNGNHADVGKVLTVKTNSETETDELVWDMPTSPQVTVDNETIMNGANGLHVNPGYGLTIRSGALCAHIETNAGLESDSSGIRVVPDKGIMITSSGGVGINFTGASDGKVLTAHETEDTDEDNNPIYDVEWKSIEGVPPTSGASDGDVLTYKDSDGIVWAPAQGGGGSDPFSDLGEWDDGKTPPTKVKDYDKFPLETKNLYISVKKEDGILKHRISFQYGGSGEDFYGPWAS